MERSRAAVGVACPVPRYRRRSTALLPPAGLCSQRRGAAGTLILCTTDLSAGKAFCSSSKAPIGRDTVIATYAGDTTFGGSQARAISTVEPSTSASAPPASPGGVGTTETVSYTRTTCAVTLVKAFDPARPATSTVTTPKAGDRYVATLFSIRDTGTSKVKGDANDSVTVIGSTNETYTPAIATFAECTNFDYGSFQLSRGKSASGCVVFEVPKAIGVTSVMWSPTLRFGGRKPAEWST